LEIYMNAITYATELIAIKSMINIAIHCALSIIITPI
jgi:hypothetical protein